GSPVEHLRRHRVPEEMTGAGLVDAGDLDVAPDLVPQVVGVKGHAEIRQEEKAFVGSDSELGPDVPDIALDPEEGALSDRHDAVLLPLALPDHQRAAREADVIELQVDELAPTDPRRVQRLQDRAVPDAVRRRDVRLSEDALGLLDGQDVTRE